MFRNSIRQHCSQELLKSSRENKDYMRWGGRGRGYENPEALIRAIQDPAHQLAAQLQLEGGFRCEGVGFPRSGYSKNKLTSANLKGVKEDSFFGDCRLVGEICTTEKGGLASSHFVPVETYCALECYLTVFGALYGRYAGYLKSINKAAKITGQSVPGRGDHAFKHNFAQRFFTEAARVGKSKAAAEVETSKRLAHRRGDVFVTYYSGRR